MIVQAKGDGTRESPYEADVPEGIEPYVISRKQNDDGTYTIELSEEYKQLSVIRAAQGKAQLIKLGLYNDVVDMVEESDGLILHVFWTTDSHWNKDSPTIQSFAKQLDIDLDQFFKEAKEIII